MSGTVLLSGFEPFGGRADNPSQQVVQALDGAHLADGSRVHGLVLPVDYEAAPRLLLEQVGRLRPRSVLALGLAVGRREISVERVALNLRDAAEPDNAGACPIDRPVLAGGAAAHFATWPVKAAVAALQAAGFEAAPSLSAGSYVCNALFYRLLEATAGHGIEAGFLHLPPAEVLAPARQVGAVRCVLDAARQSRST